MTQAQSEPRNDTESKTGASEANGTDPIENTGGSTDQSSGDSTDDGRVRYAEVGIDVPLLGAFTYSVPSALAERLKPGHLVHVPWRQRSRAAVVIRTSKELTVDLEPGRIKPIEDILDAEPLLDEQMLELVEFIARYYRAPVGEAAKLAIPAGLRREGQRSFTLTDDGVAWVEKSTALFSGQPILEALELLHEADGQTMTGPQLQKKVRGLTYDQLDQAVENGLIESDYDLDRPSVNVATEDWVRRVSDPDPERRRLGSVQKAVMEALADRKPRPLDELRDLGSSVRQSIKALAERGLVQMEAREVIRDPMLNEPLIPVVEHELTEHQKASLDVILSGPQPGEKGGFRGHLLHGVTGSGKTEVYIRAIRHFREQGYTAIVMLPEIALTPQFCSIFRSHFGDDVAVLHSGLTQGERYDAWRRARRGELGIAIGARSALFAPLQNLGIIVVDEEHDGSFKQGENPRYHGRDMALFRGKLANCRVVLGSATPSLESFHLARLGRLEYLPMPNRVGGRPLPKVEIIDMSDREDIDDLLTPLTESTPADNQSQDQGGPPSGEAGRGNTVARGSDMELAHRMLSRRLLVELDETLHRGEQAIILLNRRGHATFVLCTYCGNAIYCPHCDVSLTYHKHTRRLHCHYCDYHQPLPPNCAHCGRPDLALLGIGTERLTSMLSRLFPDRRIARLDRDTGGGSRLRKLLHRFRQHEIDVLVGTQMVAKGHDIHNVTLVGVVSADMSLHFPDFRSSERTFQLLAQVAGRAGRGTRPGLVLIQAYSHEHPVLGSVKQHSYEEFVTSELQVRADLAYPPYAHLVSVRFEGRNGRQTERCATQFGHAARANLAGQTRLLGPTLAPISRLRGRTRYQTLFKADDRAELHRSLNAALSAFDRERKKRFREVRVIVDVDPLDML